MSFERVTFAKLSICWNNNWWKKKSFLRDQSSTRFFLKVVSKFQIPNVRSYGHESLRNSGGKHVKESWMDIYYAGDICVDILSFIHFSKTNLFFIARLGETKQLLHYLEVENKSNQKEKIKQLFFRCNPKKKRSKCCRFLL